MMAHVIHDAPTREAPPPLPASHECAKCAYPVGLSNSVICPECGHRATEREVEGQQAASEAVNAWRAEGRNRHVTFWVCIVVTYSIGAGVVGRDVLLGLVATPIALTTLVSISWAAGWVVSRAAPVARRSLSVVCWRRSLWIMHLPWLVSPVFVIVALGVAAADLTFAQGLYESVVVLGLLLWALACLAAFIAWFVTFTGRSAVAKTPPGNDDLLGFFVGGALFIAAMVLGFAGGSLAAIGVTIWTGVGGIWMD